MISSKVWGLVETTPYGVIHVLKTFDNEDDARIAEFEHGSLNIVAKEIYTMESIK